MHHRPNICIAVRLSPALSRWRFQFAVRSDSYALWSHLSPGRLSDRRLARWTASVEARFQWTLPYQRRDAHRSREERVFRRYWTNHLKMSSDSADLTDSTRQMQQRKENDRQARQREKRANPWGLIFFVCKSISYRNWQARLVLVSFHSLSLSRASDSLSLSHFLVRVDEKTPLRGSLS